MKIGKVIRQHAVDRSKIVDSDTGEVVEGHATLKVYDVEVTDLRTITLSNFSTFSTDKILFLSQILSHADLGKILIISEMLMTSWNIIYNGNNRPHSTSTLATALGMRHIQSVYPFLDRMTSNNIIATKMAKVNGVRQRIYYFNPYISKRRRTVHYRLIEMFDMGDHSNMYGKAEDEYMELEFDDIEIEIDDSIY